MKSPKERMIPWNTKLTDAQYVQLKSIIKRREHELKRRMPPEQALWLMEELEHIRELYKYNTEIRL